MTGAIPPSQRPGKRPTGWGDRQPSPADRREFTARHRQFRRDRTRKMPKAFVRWTRLTRNGRRYRVTLNPTEGTGPLAAMAAANFLTIIPERTSVKAGDTIEVLPLDWMGIQSLA